VVGRSRRCAVHGHQRQRPECPQVAVAPEAKFRNPIGFLDWWASLAVDHRSRHVVRAVVEDHAVGAGCKPEL
jgi:hypothetical protein